MWTVVTLVLLTFLSQASGEENYLLAFPQNNNADVDAAAVEPGGWYQVLYPNRNQSSSNVTIDPNSRSLTHIIDEMTTTNGIEDKAVIVNASDSLSIYGYGNGRFYFSPLPIYALGVKYIVSSCYPSADYNTVLVVASHSQRTDVNITFRLDGNVTYDNRTYTDGETLVLSLHEYQTFTIYSKHDLSGTVIIGRQSIAVFSGTRYLGNVVAYDQLLPVKHHGQEYVVAVDDNTALYELQITGEYRNTQIMFNNGSVTTLDGNGLHRQMLAQNDSLSFNTTRTVLTTLCKGLGGSSGFLVVPAISLSIYQTAFYVYSGTLKIFVAKNQKNTSSSSSQIEWKDIPGSRFTVGTRSTAGSIVFQSRFGVLAFNSHSMYNGGYNFTSGNNTLSNINVALTTGEMVTQETTPTTAGMVTQETTSTTGEMVTQETTSITSGMVTQETTSTTSGMVTQETTPTTRGMVTQETTPTTGEMVTQETTPTTGGMVTQETTPTTAGMVTQETTPTTGGMVTQKTTPTTVETVTQETTPPTIGIVTEETTPTRDQSKRSFLSCSCGR